MTTEHKVNEYTPWPETYGAEPTYHVGGVVWPPTREWIAGEKTEEYRLPAEWMMKLGKATD